MLTNHCFMRRGVCTSQKITIVLVMGSDICKLFEILQYISQTTMLAKESRFRLFQQRSWAHAPSRTGSFHLWRYRVFSVTVVRWSIIRVLTTTNFALYLRARRGIPGSPLKKVTISRRRSRPRGLDLIFHVLGSLFFSAA